MDDQCGEIKTKKEPVTFINYDNYTDGDCIKDESPWWGKEEWV